MQCMCIGAGIGGCCCCRCLCCCCYGRDGGGRKKKTRGANAPIMSYRNGRVKRIHIELSVFSLAATSTGSRWLFISLSHSCALRYCRRDTATSRMSVRCLSDSVAVRAAGIVSLFRHCRPGVDCSIFIIPCEWRVTELQKNAIR